MGIWMDREDIHSSLDIEHLNAGCFSDRTQFNCKGRMLERLQDCKFIQ
jgi:hypothetical protein